MAGRLIYRPAQAILLIFFKIIFRADNIPAVCYSNGFVGFIPLIATAVRHNKATSCFLYFVCMKKNILITGFMGVGKSRTARALATASDLFAVDTDDLIESLIHSTISAFFEAHGEPAFRRLEQQLANWLESSVDRTIVSTGGGFCMVPNLMRLGQVFFLDADFDAIYERLRSQSGDRQIAKRPLFQDPDKARTLYKERLPLYRSKAHHIIKVQGRESSVVALEIRDILHSHKLLPERL